MQAVALGFHMKFSAQGPLILFLRLSATSHGLLQQMVILEMVQLYVLV